MNRKRVRKPTHPGVLLLNEFLKPNKISIASAAEQLSVSRMQLSDICNGKSRMTPDIAEKVAAATDTTIQSWLNMQTKRDDIE